MQENVGRTGHRWMNVFENICGATSISDAFSLKQNLRFVQSLQISFSVWKDVEIYIPS